MIISKTPLRISFAGGGTDLRSFYRDNKYGAVISTSINSYLYVTLKKQTELFEEKYRLNYSETERVNNLEDIQNPIIKECIRFLEIDDRLYISTISDSPGSTGLGSSSAFCVGLLNALFKFKGETISAGSLADLAAHIECDILKRPMGKQDHYAAAYGGINYIRFYDDETVTIRPINMSSDSITKFSDSISMFYTGVTRASESILKEQDDNNKSNVAVLTKMKNQASELSKILLSDNFSVEQFGSLMHKGWECKKSLASKISNNSIDKCYKDALDSGAIGGKISGAGGGGFLILISTSPKNEKITSSMAKHGLVKYNFGLDSSGTTVVKLD